MFDNPTAFMRACSAREVEMVGEGAFHVEHGAELVALKVAKPDCLHDVWVRFQASSAGPLEFVSVPRETSESADRLSLNHVPERLLPLGALKRLAPEVP